MSVDHATSKATYGSDNKGILRISLNFFQLFRYHVYFAWKVWYKE